MAWIDIPATKILTWGDIYDATYSEAYFEIKNAQNLPYEETRTALFPAVYEFIRIENTPNPTNKLIRRPDIIKSAPLPPLYYDITVQPQLNYPAYPANRNNYRAEIAFDNNNTGIGTAVSTVIGIRGSVSGFEQAVTVDINAGWAREIFFTLGAFAFNDKFTLRIISQTPDNNGTKKFTPRTYRAVPAP